MIEAITSPILIWFIIGLALILAEFAVPGIILIFFGIGAWVVSAMCAVIDASLNTQLFVFLISSVLSLALLRTWVKKTFVGNAMDGESSFNSDELVGQKAVTVHEIKPGFTGKVEFRGTRWNAVADELIEESQPVEIVKQDNLTLVVKPFKSN
ncbi:protein of unknown function DUF107 [Desulfatibacillum aliphaticivorans]|uniref:NfeD-like C-terminal domain-containing protein n=1 Tax=Desulfatibacillum aliphaticivorans TaxID=218208 RepID=B8FLT4_DESAL|nr:NfeD family protein [Desulfatibacillum aliphaticivorans]ACL05438.1 protein of unknown function DUF107 [Desulfatibacillum aliphaticivorans]